MTYYVLRTLALVGLVDGIRPLPERARARDRMLQKADR